MNSILIRKWGRWSNKYYTWSPSNPSKLNRIGLEDKDAVPKGWTKKFLNGERFIVFTEDDNFFVCYKEEVFKLSDFDSIGFQEFFGFISIVLKIAGRTIKLMEFSPGYSIFRIVDPTWDSLDEQEYFGPWLKHRHEFADRVKDGFYDSIINIRVEDPQINPSTRDLEDKN